MPVYVYACQGEQGCGDTREMLFSSVTKRRDFLICDCGRVMTRDFSQEGFTAQPDIEPGVNPSTGMHVGSRRELREQLAHLNAYSPDIPHGDPSDGVLTKEERRELETGTRVSRTGNTIFEKRRQLGWGRGPADPSEGITVEGTADYSEIKQAIKARHVHPRDRKKPLGARG